MKMLFTQKLEGIKKETEDKPEDGGRFQVYDLRDSDLEKIYVDEFTNSVIFFATGDFVEEIRLFEEALDRQDGIFNMKPRKYFNFFVVTNTPCSPMLKEMVVRDENGLEQLKYPFPIVLDVHGKLGTRYPVSTFIGIGIEGEQLFEFKLKTDEKTTNASDMDIVAMMIKNCLE